MQPQIAWEKSDRLLSGSTLAIRAVGLPEQDELRSAVALTLYVPPGSVQVAEDGSATVTLLVAADEALGASAWLREASLAAQQIGPPLYSWDDSSEISSGDV
jgi:hypothetical protein